jgi:alkaline phosphatase D
MSRPLTRRSFLALAAGAAAGASGCSGSEPAQGPTATATSAPRPATSAPPDLPPVPPIEGMPFALGVSSGDPLPDRVVLWTRLAPRPLGGGGMPDAPAPVLWEVATDERFADVVARGAHVAEPRWAHSVHVDAAGLSPDSWYWYRFRVGDHLSPVGRTRTAPPAGVGVRAVRFGFASCQDWTDGHYSAYPHLVAEDLDLLVWLGDFIYGGGTPEDAVRAHNGTATQTLADYRNRYGQYTSDPQLQAARAAVPWAVVWDDHEVADDYGGEASPSADPARRSAAYQAWWEHQPVRVAPPAGPSLPIHRVLDWGTLARFHALDERQYRDPAACAAARPSGVGDCPERTARGRSMLGEDQLAWLLGGLDRTPARWNVLANAVVMSRFRMVGQYNLDQWDGYAVEQRQIAELFAARPSLNPLVLTGDFHAFAVTDLKVDYDRAGAPIVGTEILGGSITSAFTLPDATAALFRALPNVRLFDVTRHGYAVVDLDADRARTRLRAVSTIMQPTATIDTLATVEVEAGRPGGHVS